jgi:hypothetical protein
MRSLSSETSGSARNVGSPLDGEPLAIHCWTSSLSIAGDEGAMDVTAATSTAHQYLAALLHSLGAIRGG